MTDGKEALACRGQLIDLLPRGYVDVNRTFCSAQGTRGQAVVMSVDGFAEASC